MSRCACMCCACLHGYGVEEYMHMYVYMCICKFVCMHMRVDICVLCMYLNSKRLEISFIQYRHKVLEFVQSCIVELKIYCSLNFAPGLRVAYPMGDRVGNHPDFV